ncbi:MAG: hypothetical protein NQ127_04510, partial [Candidatus Cardinium sp.]|nr:hypothetical protein [Candidatus Cardinium sp.]
NTGQACQESKPKLEPDSFGTQETYPTIPLKPKPETASEPKSNPSSSKSPNQSPPSNILTPTDEYEKQKQNEIALLLKYLDYLVRVSNLLCAAEGREEINIAYKKVEEVLKDMISHLPKTGETQPIQQFYQILKVTLQSGQPERKKKIEVALAMFKKSIKDYCNSLNRL